MYVKKNLMFAPPASHEMFPQSSVTCWGDIFSFEI